MTLGERIRSLHRARALSPLYSDSDSDSDCIGLDYSRTLPRFAAICRNLPQAVIRGFGVLRFAVADALVFAPIWELTLPRLKPWVFSPVTYKSRASRLSRRG